MLPYPIAVVGTVAATLGGAYVGYHILRALTVAGEKSYALPLRPTPWPTRPPAVALQPWEVSASLVAPVGTDYDDDVADDPPEDAVVGTGSPAELCYVPNPVPEEVTCVLDPLQDPRFAPRPSAAPFAKKGAHTIWPLETDHKQRLVTSYWTEDGLRGKWGREFGAKRTSKSGTVRRHVGIDLFANVGDAVVAPERGRILAILPFTEGTWAVYLRTDGDQVINLGEVQKFSWREFGRKPGDQVERGDPVARIGLVGTKHMLHTEIYDAAGASDEDLVQAIRRGDMQWHDETPPPRVLDPSAYYVDAATRTYRLDPSKT